MSTTHEQAAPEKATPEQATPEQVTPEQATPEQATPEQVTPEQAAEEEAEMAAFKTHIDNACKAMDAFGESVKAYNKVIRDMVNNPEVQAAHSRILAATAQIRAENAAHIRAQNEAHAAKRPVK